MRSKREKYTNPMVECTIQTVDCCSLLIDKARVVILFIMNQQSERYRQNIYVGVGVMKDYKLKLRNLHVSHTLLSCLL
jgi:hypothetical protein